MYDDELNNMITVINYLYSVTIDRTKFREVVTRYIVFILPFVFWGRDPYWWGLIFVAAGLFMRAWGAGYLQKDRALAQTGPYLVVRHPLYFGSCLLALGLIIAFHHWAVTLFLGGLTFLVYRHQIRHEEKNLRATFGDAYVQYSRMVGPLWPKLAGLKLLFSPKVRHGASFSGRQFMKNREYECILGVAIVIALLWLGSAQS